MTDDRQRVELTLNNGELLTGTMTTATAEYLRDNPTETSGERYDIVHTVDGEEAHWQLRKHQIAAITTLGPDTGGSDPD